ncbi:hypothetical protein [Desulfoplanes formicivorans]|uniref:Uncharacterized protein n=1 Tax=Desulfoplanes formicivorans TaxID=1592317 RepID=A0A194AGW2_9BACT|nr:hypothetical protein [Desulfoplanes formicivorans]GAU09317.1 hypothetical protein DPF_2040 [Desulfoplanes formicivorans]
MAIHNYHSLLLDRHPRLLVVGHNEDQISELVSMFVQSQSHIGIIGDEFPFLANLSILENIVLGAMYRQNIPLEKASKPLEEPIRALGLERWMEQRKEKLDQQTMGLCQLLRCIACGNSVVVLPSPMVAMADTIIQATALLSPAPVVWIACSVNNASAYDNLGLPTFHLES